MRDIMKSAFKETPDSFRNAINNAIAEAVKDEFDKQKPQEESEHSAYDTIMYNQVNKIFRRLRLSVIGGFVVLYEIGITTLVENTLDKSRLRKSC